MYSNGEHDDQLSNFGYPMFRQTHVWFIYVCLCIPYIYVIYVTHGSLNILDSKSVWLALLTARLRKQERVNACFLLSTNMAISRKKIDDSQTLSFFVYIYCMYMYTHSIFESLRDDYRLRPVSRTDREEAGSWQPTGVKLGRPWPKFSRTQANLGPTWA